MKIKKGDCFSIETKTKDNIFGTVTWKILEIKDGICTCEMIDGSGPSARKGFTVNDSLTSIENNIKKGIARIVDISIPKKKGNPYIGGIEC
jgi:hypothetical protein